MNWMQTDHLKCIIVADKKYEKVFISVRSFRQIDSFPVEMAVSMRRKTWNMRANYNMNSNYSFIFFRLLCFCVCNGRNYVKHHGWCSILWWLWSARISSGLFILGLLLFMKFEIESFSVNSVCKCNYSVRRSRPTNGEKKLWRDEKSIRSKCVRECFL